MRTAAMLGLVLLGCPGEPPASVVISNPTPGATVPLGADSHKSVSVDFVTTHFTVQAPGTCAGSSSCGQVYVVIDGAACDPVGQAYNNLAVSSPANAQFASCATPTGTHTLSVELHHDDGTPVKDASGQTVSASVTIATH